MKLYLVVRADLSIAQQAVQACHAAQEFIFEHFPEAENWRQESSTLAMLSVPDEQSLARLADRAEQRLVAVTRFREPDRANELTAIAISPRGRALVSSLPLALKTT